MRFLVARPLPKAKDTQAALIAAGFLAHIAPVITIEISQSDLLIERLNKNKPNILVITSTYAVEWLTQQVLTYPLSQVDIVCIGKSSETSFKQYVKQKVPADNQLNPLITPSDENSEGALRLPILNNVEGKNIILLKGDGGRTLLANTLQERGANLTELCVYKRSVNTLTNLNSDYTPNSIQCIIVTSIEVAQAAFSLYDNSWLQNLTWMVASPRIKDYAMQQGVISIIQSQGASQQAIVECATHLAHTGVIND
jgi:uroporphyrinogen-III synthase